MEEEEKYQQYTNKFTLNQRAGSVEINNSTGREALKLSHYSGSNITMNNVVNNELATNNKQTKVVFDEFKTVGNTLSETTGKDKIVNISGNSYNMTGYPQKNIFNNTSVKERDNSIDDEDSIDYLISEVYEPWKALYRQVAESNGRFSISRGGELFPGSVNLDSDGSITGASKLRLEPEGERADNPDRIYACKSVNGTAPSYGRIPEVKNDDGGYDDVARYRPIGGSRCDAAPTSLTPSSSDLDMAFGREDGTEAPGLIEFGPNRSASTQDGNWQTDNRKSQLGSLLSDIQSDLLKFEAKMGDGGDEVTSIKRHKVENVGCMMNDYPSIRVDPKGKSVVSDVGVGVNSTYTHRDHMPMAEDVDNASNFPCGNYTLNVGNKYSVTVGSGGVQINTTGPLTFNGTGVKLTGVNTVVSGTAGLSLGSESNIDISAPKIHLRSPRQIAIGSSLGVNGNTVIRGGLSVEGEVYVHHITAPVEIQETHDTRVYGKFNTTSRFRLKIGDVRITEGSSAGTYPVYADPAQNLIRNAPHSHHFNNLPLKLKRSNAAVRESAINNKINKSIDSTLDSSQAPGEKEFRGDSKLNTNTAYATSVCHEFKEPEGPLPGRP